MSYFRRPQPLETHTPQDDFRVGHLLGRSIDPRQGPKAVIVGVPCDEGVRRAGRPVGVSQGPDAIRRELYSLTPDGRSDHFRAFLGTVEDLGDLAVSGDVEQDQALLGAALGPYIRDNVIAIVLGGGQDTSYGHFLAYADSGLNVAILNWDAESGTAEDNDEMAGSESAFRRALTHRSHSCRLYTVAGLQPSRTPAPQLDFITNRSGRFYWANALDRRQIDEIYGGRERRVMVSFDLQAVDQSQAPGVGRPTVGGLDAETWLYVARKAGRSTSVSSIDLVELNPSRDPDGRTARLAAMTIWSFIAGLAERFST